MKKFLLDMAERAVKTAAQTAIATFGGSAVDLLHFEWAQSLGVTLGAAVLSILTSLASLRIGGNKDSASLVK